MSNKPLANPTAFTGQAPPWSLTQLDANFNAIQATINDTLTYSNYFVDQSGVVNSVIVSIPATLSVALTAGTVLYVKINNTNTLATTITINSLVAQKIVNPDGSLMSPSQLVAGGVATLAYDGTNFQFLGSWVSPALVRTATEIANGVTPTNYAYAPGNVLRYGADATGVADATTAFSNAHSSLPSGGGVIRVPAGVYKVSAVTISKSCLIQGDGFGVTQIYALDATSDVFTITGTSITLRDFAMTANVTRTAGRYINCTAASSNVTLENLYMLGWYYGVELNGTEYALRRVRMINGVVTAGQAIRIGTGASPGSVSGISLFNVNVDNPVGAKPDSGVVVAVCGDVSLIDCEFQHCNFGMSVLPGTSQSVASLLAVNTFFDNSGIHGVRIIPQAASGSVVRMRLNGCWLSSSGTNGMLADTSPNGGTIDGLTLIDPQVLANGSHGIVLNGPIRTKITGGAIAGNTGVGVIVFAPTSQWQIQDATIGPWGAIGGNTTYGIQVGAGASNNYLISGNDLRGNTTAALSDGGTGTTKNITNNLGYNPVANTAIANTSTSPVTWANNTGAPAYVSVTGTPTITTITMGGLQIGSTTGTAYLVPHGQTITVNFSAGTANVTYWGT